MPVPIIFVATFAIWLLLSASYLSIMNIGFVGNTQFDLKEDKHPLSYYGFTDMAADIQINAIINKYKDKKLILKSEYEVSHEIFSNYKDEQEFTRWSHFLFISKKVIYLPSFIYLQTKIGVRQMLQSKKFDEFLVNNFNLNLKDLPMTQRYFTMTEKEWNDEKIRDKIYKDFINKTMNLIKNKNYSFIIKPNHLSHSQGIELYNKQKWEEMGMNVEKLWNKILDTMRMDEDEELIYDRPGPRYKNNTLRMKGVIMEERYKGCKSISCYPKAIKYEIPMEIKIETLFGRVILSSSMYATHLIRFRDNSFQCYFQDTDKLDNFYLGNITKNKKINMSASQFCAYIHNELNENDWNEMIKWSEAIAQYLGLERVRLDWFFDGNNHNKENRLKFKFNEFGFPSSRRYWPPTQRYLSRIVYKIHQFNKLNYGAVYHIKNESFI